MDYRSTITFFCRNYKKMRKNAHHYHNKRALYLKNMIVLVNVRVYVNTLSLLSKNLSNKLMYINFLYFVKKQ